ncbi:MAG: Tfp pilus assembly protein FimT/FimU [Roseburia sp.]
MRKDNRGFSLVELIVVMAIMAIVVGVSISMILSMSNWKVNSAVETLDSELNKAMVSATTKGDVAGLLVYELDDKYYAAVITQSCYESGGYYALTDARTSSVTKLGDSSLTFTFLLKGVAGSSDIAYSLTNQSNKEHMSTAAEILFTKGTGRIQQVTIGGNSYNYSGIEITNDRKTRNIVIYAATGKHDVQ